MVERFEELVAWQKARSVANAVNASAWKGAFGRDFALRDQINRAAASTAANIAEGFDRGSRAEFAQFLSVAKGSCAEVRSHLYIALDRGYLTPEAFDALLEQSVELARILGSLRSSVQRQRDAQRRRPVPSP